MESHFVGPVLNGCLPGVFQSSQHKYTTESQTKIKLTDLRDKVLRTHINEESILESRRKALHTGEGGLDYISHI